MARTVAWMMRNSCTRRAIFRMAATKGRQSHKIFPFFAIMTNRFKQPLWMLPLVSAGLVALFGWWGNHELRRTIEQQLRAQLTSTLNANVTALEIWTTNQTRLATALASEPEVRGPAIKILDRSESGPGTAESRTNASDVEQLIRYLRPRLTQLGYETAQLVSTNFNIVAGSMRPRPARCRRFPSRIPTSSRNCFPLAEQSSSHRSNRNRPFRGAILDSSAAGDLEAAP